MNNVDFQNCRLFLEAQIEKNPENHELIKAYVRLIEKKTEFDISWFKGDEELRKDFEKNQTERIKAQSEVTKKSIEKGLPHSLERQY
jgi:hypothetical protein